MTEVEDAELRRQSLLLESLMHSEAFKLWRTEICDKTLQQLEFSLAQSDTLSAEVLRANVKTHYFLKEMFYRVFDSVKAANDQEKELNNQP